MFTHRLTDKNDLKVRHLLGLAMIVLLPKLLPWYIGACISGDNIVTSGHKVRTTHFSKARFDNDAANNDFVSINATYNDDDNKDANIINAASYKKSSSKDYE